ncbi:MAG: cupin domain-containing protein [Leadbetterella sp.]
MKRSSFISSFLTVITIGVTWAKQANKRIKEGLIVNAGKDRFDKPISLFEGDLFYTKVSSTDTEMDLFLWESIRVKKGGPAEHFHYDQDEWWYVLQGEFLFKVGDKTFTAKAGDSIFGPRNVPHCFSKISENEGKLLMLFQPAGKMEAYFKAVSEGVTAKMTEKEKIEFKKKHGFEVSGPALVYEKKG